MEKQFLTYELAVELKKLGFGESCFGYYTVDEVLNFDSLKMFKGSDLTTLTSQSDWTTLAPLWQQAFRFFREKYGLHYIICKNIQMDGYGYREVILIPYMEENKNTIFKTYEEAELACIRKLIEIAKEQNVK